MSSYCYHLHRNKQSRCQQLDVVVVVCAGDAITQENVKKVFEEKDFRSYIFIPDSSFHSRKSMLSIGHAWKCFSLFIVSPTAHGTEHGQGTP